MGDIDILNKFDNDKLIDVVKNYKRYGYDDELRIMLSTYWESADGAEMICNNLVI